MTLSSKADHEFDREVTAAIEQSGVNPYAIAERAVLDIEAENGTETDPYPVDVKGLAEDAAEEAQETMEQAVVYSPSIAEAAGRRARERAYDYVLELTSSTGGTHEGPFKETYRCIGCGATGTISGQADDPPGEWNRSGPAFQEAIDAEYAEVEDR